MRVKRRALMVLTVGAMMAMAMPADAAGTLAPVGSGHGPVQIQDHHVNVIINNGFAETEVIQTFSNPNDGPTEALYSFPLPTSASLSEMTVTTGETTIQGEVLPKQKASRVYEQERDQGNQAGLASKEGYERFEFRIAPLKPGVPTTIRFVYYQPVPIDTGIGRYHYPLEEGQNDAQAQQFWLNDKVDGTFSVRVTVKSAWPVVDVRAPGFESKATVTRPDESTHTLELVDVDASLNRDFLLYYRLQDDLPGRVEVIPYRDRKGGPGTFMAVVTPGVDLQPITGGSDTLFVVDTSGSMSHSIATLADALQRTLGQLKGDDRFRIVTFADDATDITGGWVRANEKNVQKYARKAQSLAAGGGTNLYDGLKTGLRGLDDERATSVVLITDAVTNRGVIDPRRFPEMLERYDVRIFGFLLGNSGNWPLMQSLAEETGGFYTRVSNADDILGQLLLAKGKIKHEALHNVRFTFSGAEVTDLTHVPKKIYRGQQVVVFGRYKKGGKATLKIDAALTGEDKTYTTTFRFPDTATDNPELERLWAMGRVERLEYLSRTGKHPEDEVAQAVRKLGVEYQLVTDETSMVVLSDDAFERHGVERRNQRRAGIESQAKDRRASQPVQNYRVDNSRPAFKHRSPSAGRGGGALDPWQIALMLMALGLVAATSCKAGRREHGDSV